MIGWIIKVIKENIQYFPQTLTLAKGDLKRTHMTSDFGTFWAFAKPIMYLLMFYVAIAAGFKASRNIEGTVCPYFIWLAAGVVQWQYISDLLLSGAKCYTRRKNIICNMRFPLTTVPMISVVSRFFTYAIMVGLLLVTAILMGVKPSIYWLQLPIYSLLTMIFLYLWSMTLSMITIISSDILEFIKTIRTAFFWLSGILFNVKGRTNPIFTFNPISYLAEGFRNSLAYHIWIWEEKTLFLHFVIILLILTVMSSLLYRRLEKRLPELL